jgi:hypothetical protein
LSQLQNSLAKLQNIRLERPGLGQAGMIQKK